MKFFIFLSAFISCIWAESYLYPVPLQRLQTPLLVVRTKHQQIANTQQQQQQVEQYFTQGTLGQYSYGYVEPLSTKQEIRTADGITTGSYSYIDANGLLQTVDYTADDAGFHVVATNLPQNNEEVPKPVEETAEVAAAREQHLAAHRAILEGNRSASSILPKPVEDTIEVAAAKKEFFARFAAESEKQKLLRQITLLRNQQIIEPSSYKSVNSYGTKATIRPEVGGFTYGFRINGGAAATPAHYYLPLV